MTPKKNERLFPVTYSKDLIEIAIGDLKTAKALISAPDIRIENAFYMVQQSVEKCLKAVLVSLNVPVPLVHDLGILLGKLPQDIEPPYGYELNELNQYASIRRYEEGYWKPTNDELTKTIARADEIISWAREIIFRDSLTGRTHVTVV